MNKISALRILQKFKRLFSPDEKKKLVLIFILMFFGAFLEMLSVSMIVPIVLLMLGGETDSTGPLGFLSSYFTGTNRMQTIVILLLFLIVLYLAKNAYLCFEYLLHSKFINQSKKSTKKRLLYSYLNQDYMYYLQESTGEIVRVINSDAEWAYFMLKDILSMFIECIVAVFLFICLAMINPVISLGLCGLMLIEGWGITKVLSPKIQSASVIDRKHQALANTWILQIFTGIKEVYVSQKKSYFIDRFDLHSSQATESRVKADFFSSLPRNIIESVTVTGMILLILIYVTTGHSINELIPALSAFVMAAIRLLPSFNRINSAKLRIAYDEVCLDKILEILEDPMKPQEDSELQKLTLEKNCMLSDIVFTYPETETPVLNHADMLVPVGAFVGLIGKSGTGKTTAVDILLGLLSPQQGSVLADDTPVNSNSDWLSHIGYIPQSIFLLNASIEENVAFGIPKEEIDREKVRSALEMAQIWDFVQALPMGVETVTGENGVRLSGGQKQRIGIARALYKDPELLILDEATSSLDSETEDDLIDAINALHGKKTLIVISHRLNTLKYCDILYKVKDGRIVRADK